VSGNRKQANKEEKPSDKVQVDAIGYIKGRECSISSSLIVLNEHCSYNLLAMRDKKKESCCSSPMSKLLRKPQK